MLHSSSDLMQNSIDFTLKQTHTELGNDNFELLELITQRRCEYIFSFQSNESTFLYWGGMLLRH